MTGYRRLVANTGATLAGRVASIGLALAVSTAFFRLLGSEAYGVWSFFFVLLSQSSAVELGLTSTVERFVAEGRAQGNRRAIEEVLGAATVAVLLCGAVLQLGVLLVPAGAFTAFEQGERIRQAVLVMPVCLALSGLASVAGAGLGGTQEMGRLNAYRTGFAAARSGAVLLAVLAGVTRLDVLLLLYSAGAGVQALVLWKAVAARVGPLRFRPRAIGGERLKQLLRFGLAVQGTTLATQLGDQALRLVIGARFGAAWMGYYDLGSRAAFLVRSLAGVLLTAMVSFSTDRFVRGGPQSVARLHDLSFKYTAAITLSLTGLLLYRSADLIRLWLGAGKETAPILQAFVVLAVLHGISALAGPAAVIGRGAGKPGVEAAIMLASAALGLAAAAAAPSFVASLGSFWAAMTAGAVLVWRLLARLVGFRWILWKGLAVAAACAVIGIAAAWIAERLIPTPSARPVEAVRLLVILTVGAVSAVSAAWHAGLVDRDEKAFWVRGWREVRGIRQD